MREKYKPGDSVMPKLEMEREDSEDEADRRMMEEVRELSLRDVRVPSGGSYESRVRHGGRPRDRDTRDEDARQRRRPDEARRRRREGQASVGGDSGSAMGDVDRRSQARQIEHQSSLRSLLSGSEGSSAEMQEEILRQIMDEGLLDGIDLNNMNVAQEDELSERIADAYRRRHGQRPRSQDARSEDSRGVSSRSQRSEEHQPRQRHQTRSSGATEQGTHSSHPPVSRPHLLEAYPARSGHRRRTSSGNRQPPSPEPGRSSRRSSSDVQRQGARSAIDLSTRPRSSQADPVRPRGLSQGRRTTEPQTRRRDSDSGRRPVIHTESRSDIPALRIPDRTGTERSASVPGAMDTIAHYRPSGQPPPSVVPAAENASVQRALHPQDAASSRPTTSSSLIVTSRPRPLLYPEPSLTCDRCGKTNIEYELHKNCSACKDGNFNLCLRCYRLGLGCLHWFGFGNAAWMNYERQLRQVGYPQNPTLPHTLTGRRYLKPRAESIQLSDSEGNRPLVTSDDPTKRLQAGNFCSNCFAFCNDCFWKCEPCNEGEWGFCTRCVNQGKCCTHPLLPIVETPDTKPRDPVIPAQQPSPRSTSTSLTGPDAYKPLAISTTCSLCRYPIQPSSTRFHCPQCDDHASSICTPCYLKLVSSSRISPENGDKGWRRCLRGHRMLIVGFEDSAKGQRRIVVKDRVGGWNLHEGGPAPEGDELWTWRDGRGGEASMLVSQNVSARVGRAEEGAGNGSLAPPGLLADRPFPPSGGAGMRVRARWAFWPREGVEDELGFPRGADVVEAEDVNGDWWMGRYCGRGGLVPGNYWD